ncbi:MAG: Holliday junction resolvase-like protein [Thermoplasmata archaeon]
MSSPILLFQKARTILCLCPCCSEIVRLSDLKLRYEGVTPETWLDKYQRSVSRFEAQLARFRDAEAGIREEAREKGRKKARKRVVDIIDSALPGCKYHPQDIKAVLHPIDYVVFCGMTEGDEIDKIARLSVETDDNSLRRVRRSIERTIDGESYSWNVARVLDDGTVNCTEK